ncbi:MULTISPECIES: hypothetical protein [unclassified Shewanella]|uniref:hypothetical protein n=1 Tax=unclassified Shewanella TaxID=196818 RepID=UPI0006D68975|nr:MULTISPECIES: hypothetical protein [unclassified Shewanella]KPZ69401.1 hypothetical protein AN944_02920 [Shewanella sp. P1-14-1]OBT05337.1 hypothetical protein A9267_15875 [Shewanella sp. UCD-FRSSP16_17]
MNTDQEQVTEFIEREQREETTAPVVTDNRDHIRHSLRESNEELAQACDGISVKLHQKIWFITQELGIANIKDISLGGVGLITPLQLELNQSIWLEVEQSLFEFTIMRQYPINQRLNFIGGKWKSKPDDINKLLVYINNAKA